MILKLVNEGPGHEQTKERGLNERYIMSNYPPNQNLQENADTQPQQSPEPQQSAQGSQQPSWNGQWPMEREAAPTKKKGGGFFWGILYGVVLTLAVIGVVVLIRSPYLFSLGGSGGLNASEKRELVDKVDELVKAVEDRAVEEVTHEQLLDGAYHGMISSMEDQYAEYFNQKEYEAFQTNVSGRYSGIGVTVGLHEDGGAEVLELNPKGSAIEAGIEVGDIIIRAGETDLTNMQLQELITYIRGEEGTFVDVTLIRDGQEMTFSVERRKIDAIMTYCAFMEGNVGYIVLEGFEGNTYDQFMMAVGWLNKQGMEALVLDLRDNPGGLVNVAVQIADEFLDAGLISYVEDKYGHQEVFDSYDGKSVNCPVTVLINGNSASSAEILAGALQDRGAATIVGTTSFGKGIIQTTFPLSDGTALKVTTAKYFTPNGTWIHGAGITPDVEVELADGKTFAEVRDSHHIPIIQEDTQLKACYEIFGIPLVLPEEPAA